MRIAFVLIFVVVLTSNTSAHETWLLPRQFGVEVGKPVTFDLTSGMKFPELEHPIKADRLALSRFRIAGKVYDIKEPTESEKSLARDVLEASAPQLFFLDKPLPQAIKEFQDAPEPLFDSSTIVEKNGRKLVQFNVKPVQLQ